ncbi:hypothetical protein B0T22DRAFT_292976 [Podospora appendiculata]|uniref:Zn(2)-C6 fungal-type domain-containing protein n=1 Tax=Podospora appendiculata TaxID=314037 RepID=A0AAE1C8D2_9PEZI|nr:hypothetical protein B0T22DRAFT_292976 [Podospora appendiculata]
MSTSSEDGPLVSSESGGSGGITGAAEATTGCESLACVSCRARKLKCDRQIPVCVRCVKSGGECVYPESRRKPATKRRNVKELEDRLAQVEGLLKGVIRQPVSPDATTQPNNQNPARASVVDEAADSSSDKFPCNDPRQDSASEGYAASRPPADNPETVDNPFQSDELLGLGRFEALPPLELIEELHDIFFKTQKYFIHVIHQGNYLRSFYNSAPHMRPPMALQYAIWTTAAHGHDKYGGYHDIFYQRTRQYLQADELKGCGEHFITIAHAQAWAFIAIDEGRSMLFTRVAMSSARLIRLVQMMELHRLDGPPIEADDSRMAPPLAAPQTWTELEERRRLFWGAYCIDSHASISTGWPSLIDIDEVTTKLPASEDAFSSGIEENSSTLQDVFRGGGYSTFGASVCACLIFNLLMKHVHRPMPGDRPDDVSHGPFWKNHRDIDNILSNAFMFLPERFRLPSNLKDPIAVHTNLNLHASVICLHNAACDKADKFNLPSHIKQASKTRSLAAAHEIVRIMKSTSSTTQEHVSSPFWSSCRLEDVAN